MQFIKIEQSVVGIIYGISLTIFMICAVLAMIKVKRKMKNRKLDKPNYRLGKLIKLTKVSSINSSSQNLLSFTQIYQIYLILRKLQN